MTKRPTLALPSEESDLEPSVVDTEHVKVIRVKKKVEVVFSARFQVREVVWCDFENEPSAIAPEFIGTHPCIIISTVNNKDLPHLVIPLTSKKPDKDCPYTHELSKKPIKNKEHSVAICSHIYSVSHKRLKRPWRKVRISQKDFDAIMVNCYKRLHKLPE